jgi:hypothetical protein
MMHQTPPSASHDQLATILNEMKLEAGNYLGFLREKASPRKKQTYAINQSSH